MTATQSFIEYANRYALIWKQRLETLERYLCGGKND